jgi:hypothetical protein
VPCFTLQLSMLIIIPTSCIHVPHSPSDKSVAVMSCSQSVMSSMVGLGRLGEVFTIVHMKGTTFYIGVRDIKPLRGPRLKAYEILFTTNMQLLRTWRDTLPSFLSEGLVDVRGGLMLSLWHRVGVALAGASDLSKRISKPTRWWRVTSGGSLPRQ